MCSHAGCQVNRGQTHSHCITRITSPVSVTKQAGMIVPSVNTPAFSPSTVKERFLRLFIGQCPSCVCLLSFAACGHIYQAFHIRICKGQLPYLSSEGSLFCLVAVLSCDSNCGGKVFPHILEIDGRWGDHHLCVWGEERGSTF